MDSNKHSQDGDDVCTLPADTLQILNEFLLEKALREQKEQESITQKSGKDVKFDENWQLSQFWYSDKTILDFSKLCKKIINVGERIGLLSCPSLYPSIKEAYENVKIFEYDDRFSSFGDDFVFYDFNEAEDPDYLSEHHNTFDLIIADPPFLSEECIHKISQLIKRLKKEKSSKVIMCSGEIVENWVEKCLGLQKRMYKPEHERNLGNEFVSYANFNIDEFL